MKLPIIITLIAAPVIAGCYYFAPAPTEPEVARIVPHYPTAWTSTDTIEAVNRVRSSYDLPPLTENVRLDNAAAAKADDMCRHNYWSHDSPTGITPWYWINKASVHYTKAAENLAYGYSTTNKTVTAWTNSPTHLEDILGDYTDTGAATITCPNYQGTTNTTITVNNFTKE